MSGGTRLRSCVIASYYLRKIRNRRRERPADRAAAERLDGRPRRTLHPPEPPASQASIQRKKENTHTKGGSQASTHTTEPLAVFLCWKRHLPTRFRLALVKQTRRVPTVSMSAHLAVLCHHLLLLPLASGVEQLPRRAFGQLSRRACLAAPLTAVAFGRLPPPRAISVPPPSRAVTTLP